VSAEGRLVHVLRGALLAVASLAVAAIITMPVIDLLLARVFWKGIPSAGTIADHATLVLAFAAAALASLDKRHIAIAGNETGRGRMCAARIRGGLGSGPSPPSATS